MAGKYGYKNRADRPNPLIEGLKDLGAAGGAPGAGPQAPKPGIETAPGVGPVGQSAIAPEPPIGDPISTPVDQLPRKVARLVKQLDEIGGDLTNPVVETVTTNELILPPVTAPAADGVNLIGYFDEDEELVDIVFPWGGHARVALDLDDLAVEILTTTLPDASVGVAYSEFLAAIGGDEISYAWSVIDGALPTGLTLNAVTGEIAGTPTASGTFSFTVRAISAGLSDKQELTIDAVAVPVPYYPATSGTAATTGWYRSRGGVSAVSFAAALTDVRTHATQPVISPLPSQDVTVTMRARKTSGPTTYQFDLLDRGALRFDTTALAATPVSGTVQLTAMSLADAGDEFPISGSAGYSPDSDIAGGTLRLVVWTRAVNTAPLDTAPNTDWDAIDAGAYASDDIINLEDIANLDVVEFTLNAAGLAAVQQGGVTCFALEMSYDRANTVPADVTAMALPPGVVITYIVFYGGADQSLSYVDLVPPVLLVTV